MGSGADYTATPAASAALPASGGVWINLNVTALAQSWVAMPAGNYGVVLKQKTAGGYVSATFCSENSWGSCANSAWKPKLTLTYTLPGAAAAAEAEGQRSGGAEEQRGGGAEEQRGGDAEEPAAPAIATVVTKYYSIGGQRVAMRRDGVL